MSDGIEHRQIGDGVAVCVAVPERKAESRRQAADGASFCFAAHMFACEPAGPAGVADFEFGRANFGRSRKAVRHHARETRQRSADEKHAMPLRDVPGDALDSSGKKLRRAGRERVCPVCGQRFAQAGEMKLIAEGCVARVVPQRLRETRKPASDVGAADFILREEMPDEAPLERGRGQERAIEIEEGADSLRRAHRVTPAAILDGAFSAAARYRRPSQITGIARTRQKRTVVTVSAWAAIRSE